MTTQTVEKRTLTAAEPMTVETRENGSRVISGYAAVYYRKDNNGTEYDLWKDVKERIMPGAFDQALERQDDVRALFNHDPNFVLGRSTAGTLRLETNKRGLRYEVDVPDTQAGRDLLISVDRGDINGSSFAFVVDDERWGREEDLEVREIHSVQLLDVSPVTYPAYKATTAGMRADDCGEARRMHEEWREAERLQMEQEREAAQKERERLYQYSQARLRDIDVVK